MKIKDNGLDVKGAGVYRIVNLATGKIYVGSSIKLIDRYRSHASLLKHSKHPNEHLQRSYSKHGGESFEFEILEQTTKDNTLIREQYHLDKLYALSKSAFYNLSETASGSRLSNESKIKMAASVKRVVWEEGHVDRLRKQSEEINLKRRKVQDEFELSKIIVKYIANKSLISTAAQFNMSKSALARIFKKANGNYPELYSSLLAKIGFDGDSITDLHKTEIQSKLTLFNKD